MSSAWFKLNIFWILLVAEGVAFAKGARTGSFPIEAQTLEVNIHEDVFVVSDDELNLNRKNRLETICNSMGSALLRKSSMWGYGAFKKIHCAGVHPEEETKGKERWQLTVLRQENAILIGFAFVSGDVTIPIVKQLKIEVGLPESIEEVLKNTRFNETLSFLLLDSAPFSVAIDNKKTKKIKLPTNRNEPERLALPLPYDSLMVYTLAFNPKLRVWVPKVLAKTLRVASNEEIVVHLMVMAKKNGEETGFEEMVYDVAEDFGLANAEGETLFAQNSAGTGTLFAKLSSELQEIAEESESANVGLIKRTTMTASNSVSGIINGGIVSLYYGQGIQDDDEGEPGFTGLSVMKLYYEVKSGPLLGLHVYSDMIPKVSITSEDDQTFSYASSKTMLGWAINFKLKIFDRFDIGPRLGVWNLEAFLPYEDELVDFSISGGYSFGFESGFEWDFWKFWTLRFYGATDVNLGFALQDRSSKANVIRFGVENEFYSPRLIDDLRVAFTLFGYYEKLSVDKKAEKGSQEIPTSGYSQIYTGFGLGIRW